MASQPVLSTTAKSAAQRVFKTLNARLTQRLGPKWEPGPGAPCIRAILEFFSKNLVDLGDTSFGLRIDSTCSVAAGAPLTAKYVREETMKGGGIIVITVDLGLTVASVERLPAQTETERWTDKIQDLAKEHPAFYYESSSHLKVFGNGWIDDIAPSTGAMAGKVGKFDRQSLEYREAIREHYEERVKNGVFCDHWEDRKSRLIRTSLGNCKKTEEIFQQSLLMWLNEHLSDGNAWPEPKKANNDRTDIKIQPFGDGRFYFIELKWMGKAGHPITSAASGKKAKAPIASLPPKGHRVTTSRSGERIFDGIKQLAQYLSEKPRPTYATLVVYDGRDESEFSKLVAVEEPIPGMKVLTEYEKPKSIKGPAGGSEKIGVPVAGDCFVFFLCSERASEL